MYCNAFSPISTHVVSPITFGEFRGLLSVAYERKCSISFCLLGSSLLMFSLHIIVPLCFSTLSTFISFYLLICAYLLLLITLYSLSSLCRIDSPTLTHFTDQRYFHSHHGDLSEPQRIILSSSLRYSLTNVSVPRVFVV